MELIKKILFCIGWLLLTSLLFIFLIIIFPFELIKGKKIKKTRLYISFGILFKEIFLVIKHTFILYGLKLKTIYLRIVYKNLIKNNNKK